MKKINLYTGLFAAIMVGLTSCKNDLDVLAPGEESVAVYGVLNPNEAVQNIRINKVYVTDGDALTAAQDANQINYDTSEIRVSLQRFMSGSSTPTLTTVGNATKKEIVLTGTVITTASGIFNPNQIIWQTTDKLYNSGQYKLTILNKKTGKEFTSQTTVIDSVKSNSQKPFIYNPTLYPMHGYYSAISTPTAAYIDYSNLSPSTNIKIKFNTIQNAKLYSITMRFHYIDSLSSGSADTTKYIDLNFPVLSSSDLTGGEALEVSYNANDFYVNLGIELSKRTNTGIKKRRAFYMEYIIRAGAESLNTFLQVNAPSNTIAQDKPNYSNINGGVGIFSSSSRSTITHDFADSFINKIACHPSVFPYLFSNKDGTMPAGPCTP